jgi:hypothetical protein
MKRPAASRHEDVVESEQHHEEPEEQRRHVADRAGREVEESPGDVLECLQEGRLHVGPVEIHVLRNPLLEGEEQRMLRQALGALPEVRDRVADGADPLDGVPGDDHRRDRRGNHDHEDHEERHHEGGGRPAEPETDQQPAVERGEQHAEDDRPGDAREERSEDPVEEVEGEDEQGQRDQRGHLGHAGPRRLSGSIVVRHRVSPRFVPYLRERARRVK